MPKPRTTSTLDRAARMLVASGLLVCALACRDEPAVTRVSEPPPGPDCLLRVVNRTPWDCQVRIVGPSTEITGEAGHVAPGESRDLTLPEGRYRLEAICPGHPECGTILFEDWPLSPDAPQAWYLDAPVRPGANRGS